MATRIDKWREARLMATSIAAALETAQARFVLITSPSARNGKSLFVDLLQREFHALGLTRFLLMDWPDLVHYSPGASDDTIVLIDGPPLTEGEGIMQIPAEWLAALDGALIVVNKRKTRRDDLEQSVSWLRATGIEPLGLIWNEHGLPPLTDALRRWRDLYEQVREERRQRKAPKSRPPRAHQQGQPGQEQSGLQAFGLDLAAQPAAERDPANPGTTPARPAGVAPVDLVATQTGHVVASDDILESAPLAGGGARSGDPATAPIQPRSTVNLGPREQGPAAGVGVEQPPDAGASGPTTNKQGALVRPAAPRPPRGRFRGDT